MCDNVETANLFKEMLCSGYNILVEETYRQMHPRCIGKPPSLIGMHLTIRLLV